MLLYTRISISFLSACPYFLRLVDGCTTMALMLINLILNLWLSQGIYRRLHLLSVYTTYLNKVESPGESKQIKIMVVFQESLLSIQLFKAQPQRATFQQLFYCSGSLALLLEAFLLAMCREFSKSDRRPFFAYAWSLNFSAVQNKLLLTMIFSRSQVRKGKRFFLFLSISPGIPRITKEGCSDISLRNLQAG